LSRRPSLGACLLVVFAVLALAGALVPLALAFFGSENLLLTSWKDDGFYFLKLAENIARGHGASFDGLGPTNGFHPLWALLLAPIFLFHYGSPYIPVRITLVIAALLHLLAAAAVFRAARGVASPRAALVTALFYLANPLALYLVVSGMESPIVMLLLALLSGEYILLRRGRIDPGSRGARLRLGALCGLCMLARTDTVILVALVFAGLVFLPPPAPSGGAVSGAARPGPRPGGAAVMLLRLRGALFSAAVALAFVLPWIGWNLLRFHSLVQVSARAHHLHAIAQGAGGETEEVRMLARVGEALSRGAFASIQGRTGLPSAWVFALPAAAAAVFLFWLGTLLRASREETLERLRPLDAPVLYAGGFLLATFFILGHVRSWYLAGPLVVAAIALALPAEDAFYPVRRRGARLPKGTRVASALLFAGLTLGLLPLASVFGREITGNARVLHCWRDASEWTAAHTAPGERVASFNSGTFGYLAPRTVVNLDCVVNNRALPYLERRRLIEFLHENRIRYVIDDPQYVVRYLRSYGEPGWSEDLVPVDTLRSGLVAYEVR
jgi:hypothetical protein